MAGQLYDALGLQRARLRLVGVRVEGLVDADEVAEQLLLGEPDRGWREAEQAVDRAAQRFGSGAVRPAALRRPGPRQSRERPDLSHAVSTVGFPHGRWLLMLDVNG